VDFCIQEIGSTYVRKIGMALLSTEKICINFIISNENILKNLHYLKFLFFTKPKFKNPLTNTCPLEVDTVMGGY
jgi:hypothetical protein